jgi:prolyl-tRNA synthetase
VARRDRGLKEKEFVGTAEFSAGASALLASVQQGLLERATAFRDENMVCVDSLEAFEAFFTAANPEKPGIHGGFALCHWAGSAEDEERIQKQYGVTMRCIPFGDEYRGEGECFLTGKPSSRRVIFAKAY